jgi:hypothetical protein
MMTVNDQGEVSVELAGVPFRFKATLARMGAFQAAAGVTGIAELFSLIDRVDQQAMHIGLKSLCSSENADKLDDLLAGPLIAAGPAILVTAITAGVPAPPKTTNRAKGRGQGKGASSAKQETKGKTE